MFPLLSNFSRGHGRDTNHDPALLRVGPVMQRQAGANLAHPYRHELLQLLRRCCHWAQRRTLLRFLGEMIKDRTATFHDCPRVSSINLYISDRRCGNVSFVWNVMHTACSERHSGRWVLGLIASMVCLVAERVGLVPLISQPVRFAVAVQAPSRWD